MIILIIILIIIIIDENRVVERVNANFGWYFFTIFFFLSNVSPENQLLVVKNTYTEEVSTEIFSRSRDGMQYRSPKQYRRGKKKHIIRQRRTTARRTSPSPSPGANPQKECPLVGAIFSGTSCFVSVSVFGFPLFVRGNGTATRVGLEGLRRLYVFLTVFNISNANN